LEEKSMRKVMFVADGSPVGDWAFGYTSGKQVCDLLEVFTPGDPVFPIFAKLAVPFEEFNSDDLESNLEKNLVK
jgi:hypothetical protein